MRKFKFRAWYKKEKIMRNVIGEVYCECFPYDFTKNKNLVLMQYTGLKDKNGKEIFEGDIVKFDDTAKNDCFEIYNFENIAEITFNNGRYELKNFLKENTTVSNGVIKASNYFQWDNEMWFEFMNKELTIIGNIYENPELLEKY